MFRDESINRIYQRQEVSEGEGKDNIAYKYKKIWRHIHVRYDSIIHHESREIVFL